VAALVLALAIAGCRGDEEPAPKPNPPAPPAEPFEPRPPFDFSKDRGRHNSNPEETANEVLITFDPAGAAGVGNCEEIVIIQTVQTLVDGKPVRPRDYSTRPSDLMADGYSTDDLPATGGVDETGTHVDSKWLPSAHGSTPGRKTPAGTTAAGLPLPAEEADATLEDPPLAEGGDRGFRNAKNPNGYGKVLLRFESCAYCERGQDAGKFYGCLLWEHERSAEEAEKSAKGRSRFTGQADAPSDGFKDAYRRFRQRFP
jgi:hypothetical protein